MTDAEYIFKQTSAERKRIGRGDYNKKRRGGKTVRFPSDNLSRKEKVKLNGEPITYSFAKPLFWEEFKGMPNDIQQEYLDTMKEKFKGLPGTTLAKSFGVAYSTFTSYLALKHLTFNSTVDGKRPREISFFRTEDGEAWIRWHETYRKESVVEAEEVSEAKEEPVAEVKEEPAVEVKVVAEEKCDPPKVEVIEPSEKKCDSVDALIVALNALRGTGAKVRIEVVL